MSCFYETDLIVSDVSERIMSVIAETVIYPKNLNQEYNGRVNG